MNLQIAEYKNIEIRFKDWLRLLNFEPSTIKYAPIKAREFFGWLEGQQIKEIEAVNKPCNIKLLRLPENTAEQKERRQTK
jgi:hypothetical protein